jgi:hypothetical protein
VVKVRPTSDADVASSLVTRGKAGVYMSVANGGTALCNASVRISAVVTVAVPAARPPVAAVGEEADDSPRAVIQTPRSTSTPRRRAGPIRCHQMLAQPTQGDGQLGKLTCRRPSTNIGGDGGRQCDIGCLQQPLTGLGQFDQIRSTICWVRLPSAPTGSLDLVHHLARPTDGNRQRSSDVQDPATIGGIYHLHDLQPGQRKIVRALDSRVYPVPQLGLQTDQITKQPNQIDVHGDTIPRNRFHGM